MSRERFWGLYEWNTKTWILDGIGKRRRFATATAAGSFLTPVGWDMGYSPRPFYVVRKAKKPALTEKQLSYLQTAINLLKEDGYQYIARDLKLEFGL